MKKSTIVSVAALMMTTAVTSVWAAGDPVAGKGKAVLCGACHGADGNSADPAHNPSLAGMNAIYLATATRAYRDGTRVHDAMKTSVSTLSDQDIEDISAYFSGQPAKK